MKYHCKLCDNGEIFDTEEDAKEHCEDEHADRVDVNLEGYMEEAVNDTFEQIIDSDEDEDDS